MHRSLLTIAPVAVLLLSIAFVEGVTSQTAGTDSSPPYMHPEANLLVWPPPAVEVQTSTAVTAPMAAAESAAVALQRRGVKDSLIGEARWIAAAVSGFLVDALGRLTVEGVEYSVFRVGIRDGGEVQNGPAFRGGAVFVFIALGWDNAGAQI